MLVSKLFVCSTFPLGNFPNLCIPTRLKSYDCKGNLENTVSANTYSTNFLCHESGTELQLLNNAEVVFRSNCLKMMIIRYLLYFLMLKVSDQNSSISNCHDVDAKISKWRSCQAHQFQFL